MFCKIFEFCETQDLQEYRSPRGISRYSLKYVDTKEYLRFSGGIANSNDHRTAREYLLDFPGQRDKTSLERRLRSTRYHNVANLPEPLTFVKESNKGQRSESSETREWNFYLSWGIVFRQNDCAIVKGNTCYY